MQLPRKALCGRLETPTKQQYGYTCVITSLVSPVSPCYRRRCKLLAIHKRTHQRDFFPRENLLSGLPHATCHATSRKMITLYSNKKMGESKGNSHRKSGRLQSKKKKTKKRRGHQIFGVCLFKEQQLQGSVF